MQEPIFKNVTCIPTIYHCGNNKLNTFGNLNIICSKRFVTAPDINLKNVMLSFFFIWPDTITEISKSNLAQLLLFSPLPHDVLRNTCYILRQFDHDFKFPNEPASTAHLKICCDLGFPPIMYLGTDILYS